MTDPHDPKGLIRESYRIEGITAPECRTIFLDWALSMPATLNTQDSVQVLLENYAKDAPDHPMTKTLEAALTGPVIPKRRGGRRARVPD